MSYPTTCPECGGCGEIDDMVICPMCDGSGKIEEDEDDDEQPSL